jgi:methionyl-tRNA formyltransferase
MKNKPRVVFMGSGEIGLPTLRWLSDSGAATLVGVVTQPDKPVGRSQVLSQPGPKKLAVSLGVPVLQPVKLRGSEELDRLAALAPDLIVVMAYGQILPKKVLETPSLACLNLHASILPRHRGASPIQASILAGDLSTGLTVMYMAQGLDTGDILLTRSIALRRRETGGSLHDRLAILGPAALATGIELILSNTAPRIPQDESKATYAPKLERESGRIDWSQDCCYLDRLVRAMNPWPGAFTMLETDGESTKKLKIHRALPLHRVSGPSGIVHGIGKRGVLVSCGRGGLLLLEVQLEGKRKMSAAEFVRGFELSIGTLLGR